MTSIAPPRTPVTSAASPPTASPAPNSQSRGSDFAALCRRINDAGLMNRRYGYYVWKFLITDALFLGTWALFVGVGDSWWQLMVAALLGIATTQVSMLGHDVGHRQVFRTRRISEIFGLVHGDLGVGLSYGWWMDKHSRHHANPNHEDHDPDVEPGALVWSLTQARKTSGFGRWMAGHQAPLFFPLTLLEGLALHVASFKALFQAPMRYRKMEALLLVVHLAGYLTLIFMVLSPGKAVAFIALSQAIFGLYMGSSFAPNHKGMPMLTAEDDLDFLRRQVLTSRNVKGGPVVDVVLGGLNYQIEHHLFPSMPRINLRRAQPIVEAFCAERGVSYLQSPIVDSYAQALRHLHDVGAPARAASAADK